MKIVKALKWAYERTGSRYVSRELVKFSENLSNEQFVLLLNNAMKNEAKFRDCVTKYATGTPLEYITNNPRLLNH